MSRRPRLEIENGLYHVTNRGLERRDIVRDDEDRSEWLRLLGRVATRCRWRVFTHVLLDNHFHLYLRTPELNLSVGMHDLESAYVSLFNRRHDRRGPLFQDRFHAVIVENDSHSWQITRYIHLNPVRAGIVGHPGDYYWGSYHAYLDPSKSPAWLDWETVLAEFSGTEGAARLACRRFVESGLKHGVTNPFAAAVDEWILGSSGFVDRCQTLTTTRPTDRPTLCGVLESVALEFDKSIADVRQGRWHGNRAREAAILLARELCSESLAEVSECFGISPSGVTESARRTRVQSQREPEFHAVLERLRAKFR